MQRKQQKLKIFCAFFIFFYCLGSFSSVHSQAHHASLNFLTWADYINPEVVKKFESQYGVRVKFSYFESDEEREQKMAYTNGKGYDVIIASGPYLSSHVKRKWIAPIDFSQIPNIKHFHKRWREAYPYAQEYAVPYLWGTLGIAYRSDKIKEEIHSWTQLFRPAESLKGKIGLINDSKEIIGMALKSLNYSINSTSEKELKEVEELLLKQKSFVSRYTTPELSKNAPLVTGKLEMSMFYNGDTLSLQGFNPAIKYVVPKEGTGLWVDYLMISSGSKKKELAMQFIDFISEPEHAAQISSFLFFATSNQSAEKFLSSDFLNNPIIYPDQEVISRSEFFAKLPPQAERVRNHIFSKLDHN